MGLNRFSASRVERRLLGWNSSPVVVETQAGRFVLKLRGAGHGVLALVAEIVVAELAERLGLSVRGRVLFLDGLTQNLDRTPKNPNVLWWNKQPWLIDHGSALSFHHDWSGVSEDSPREPSTFVTHVFASRAPLLARYETELAGLLDRNALTSAVASVPDAFLEDIEAKIPVRVTRAAYHAYLWKRLKPPRPFVNRVRRQGSAVRARTAR
jgi:hypothetical protein